MLSKIPAVIIGLCALTVPAIAFFANPVPRIELASQAHAASSLPTVKFTKPPLATSELKTQTVEFVGAAVAPATIRRYRCSIDEQKYATCRSPHTFTVSVGEHIIRVRAVDTLNRTSDPAVAKFKVTAPVQKPNPAPTSDPAPAPTQNQSSTPTTATFYNLTKNTSFTITKTAFEVSENDAAAFSICAQNVTAPVTFTSPLGTQTENLAPFCLKGDTDSKPNPAKLGVGSHTITIADASHQTVLTLTITVKANAQGGSSLPPPAPSAEPNTLDGKPILLLGLDGWGTTNLEEPFLNLLRATGNDWTAVQNWPGPATMEMGAMLAGGFINPKTMLPKAVPPDFDMVRSGLFRGGARFDPAAYAGTYVVEWEGAGTVRVDLGCAASQKLIAAGRIEFTCAPTEKAWTRLLFSDLGPDGLKSVKVFRKEDAGRVKAGEIFSPRFLAYASRYKVLRALDIQAPNIAGARTVDQLARKRQAQWGASPRANDDELPIGPPIEVLFDLATAADAALWMHVAGPIGAPPSLDAVALGTPRQGEVKAAAFTAAAEIVVSPEWDKYADEIVRALIASGYPETRALYIETGNEVWNNAHPFWWGRDYFHGIRDWANAQSPVSGYGSMVGAGFMEARFAVAFDKALTKAGRKQAVVFVLAAQHANPATSEGAIAGFRHYFALKGIDPAPYLARAGLSTATYFHGGTGKTGLFATADDETLKAKWLAAIKANPAGTAKALTDWYLTKDQCCTIPYLVRMRKAQEAVAAKAGIAFIGDYEGESHDAAWAPLRDDPAFVGWYFKVWMDGPEGERLTREWAKALYAENPKAIIANYKGAAPREVRWPWGDGLYGENTGRRRALEEFLRVD